MVGLLEHEGDVEGRRLPRGSEAPKDRQRRLPDGQVELHVPIEAAEDVHIFRFAQVALEGPVAAFLEECCNEEHLRGRQREDRDPGTTHAPVEVDPRGPK